MRLYKQIAVCLILAVSLLKPPDLPAQTCGSPHIRCVDDDAGPGQEYATIQAAADASQPGDTIFISDGAYTGFQVNVSGTSASRITYLAQSINAVIQLPCPTGDGIRLQNVHFITLEGFKIINPADRCIAARGAQPATPMTGLVIRRNHCLNAAHEGMYLSEVSGSLIEDNVITGRDSGAYFRGHGLYLANAGSDSTVIRGNVISRNLGTEANGLFMNGDSSVGGDGIISGLTIENNLIFENGLNGLNMDGVQNSIFRNNLIYGNGHHAIRGYRRDGTEGPAGLVFINNTLLVRAGTGGWPIKLTDDQGGNVIFNNILLSEGNSQGAFAVANSDVTSDHNVVSPYFSVTGESTVMPLADWQSLGHDQASMLGNLSQLFVNPALSDYHLQPQAIAINQGLSSFAGINAPPYDLENQLRPWEESWDIGAYEFSPASTSFNPEKSSSLFLLSPVPVNSCLFIQTNKAEFRMANLKIYNVNGKEVFGRDLNLTNTRFDLSKLPNGFFIIKAQAGGQSIIKRFVILR